MENNKLLSALEQELIIEKACKLANIDCHIKRIHSRRDVITRAEQIAHQFKISRQTMPVKNSYLYCDTLDVCFFFLRGNKPAFSYAGYATANSKDSIGGLVNAFAKANEVLNYMSELLMLGDVSKELKEC